LRCIVFKELPISPKLNFALRTKKAGIHSQKENYQPANQKGSAEPSHLCGLSAFATMKLVR
jgi:hypothetical protein